MWSAALCDNTEMRKDIIKSVWNYVNESKTRVPLSDLYLVDSGNQKCWAEYTTWNGFQNRSVVGGFAILLL